MMKLILDACCGSKMFWFDKDNQNVLFLDKRKETYTCTDRGKQRTINVDPETIADFTNLPFKESSFPLVVFDPPHTYCGENGYMYKKYGTLFTGWEEMIRHGFEECFRVLCPAGTLIFKWNEHRVSLKKVLSLTDEKPLFGQKIGNSKTHWLVFMKLPAGA